MLITSAPPSVTSAPPGTKSPETARHATSDPLSKLDSVSPIPIPALSPSQIFFATSGIKRTVWNAHREASSMLMASVLPLVLNATPLTKPQETAWLVLLVMTFKLDNAFSRQPIPPDLKISDVELGIGMLKSVLLAPTNGPSMLKTSAFQFLTSAQLMMLLETALLATRDTT